MLYRIENVSYLKVILKTLEEGVEVQNKSWKNSSKMWKFHGNDYSKTSRNFS